MYLITKLNYVYSKWKGYNDSEGANNYSNRAYTYDLYLILIGNEFNEFDCVIHYLATRCATYMQCTCYVQLL